MSVLNLSNALERLVARNGQVTGFVKEGNEITGASIVFPADPTRKYPEQIVEVGREHIWQLRPFRSETIAEHIRVSEIGMIDADLLYGAYEIVDIVPDPHFQQSPFTGRWDGDNLIFHLRHLEFGTEHHLRAFRFRSVKGDGKTKKVNFNYSGRFEILRPNAKVA